MRLDKKLIAAFVLGGIAPDLDVILIWVNYVYQSNLLIFHRGFTHTFFFGFLTVLAVIYASSLGLVKRPCRINTKKTLMIFIAVLLVTGVIRIEGKEASKSFIGDSDATIYPDAGLFEWMLLEERGDELYVYGYNAISGAAEFSSTFQRFNVSSSDRDRDLGAAVEAA